MRPGPYNKSNDLVQRSRQDELARQQLLEGNRPLRVKRNFKERQQHIQAADTTKSLNSLVQRMNDEVRLSEQTTTILGSSSSVLGDTQSQMGQIGHSIKASGKLLHKYGRREFTDKVLLTLALLLYFGVCIYILRKRVFTFNLW